MRSILDFRFWISLLGVLLIAGSTTFIWFLLRKKKELKSNLLPTLGFDALQPTLKAAYIKSTLWEVQRAYLGESSHRLAREFRRTLFDLQASSYPNPAPSDDLSFLEQLLEGKPEDDDENAILHLIACLRQFRNQKKRATRLL